MKTTFSRTQMGHQMLLALVCLLSVLVSQAAADDSQITPAPVVVGYLPEYAVAAVQAEQLTGVTDLVYFGIKAPADGDLTSTVIPPSVIEQLHELKQVLQCRLLLCIGGWERSDEFGSMSTDDATRQRFVDELVKYCRQYGFDGVDYDWEHPHGFDQRDAYELLICETAEAFEPHQLLVTVAQSAFQDLGVDAYDAVDRIHLMCYDQPFPQATLQQATREAKRVIDNGCPPEKLVLGVPFYGRNREREARSYRDLVRTSPAAPSADIIDGFAINGPATMTAKCSLVKELGLGGIMIWELAQDAEDPQHALLPVLVRQLSQ